MPIRILSDLIANQIAAGEVVEGPLSVIKELVENSIDAAASSISIDLSKQFRCIKVSDNGSGIPADEIHLAFTRHATSKITEIEDLFSIQSNGFRGEALASIASVSKVTCVSRTRSEANATKFYIDAGVEELSSTGAGIGTSIEVDDLFYNTPARLKFMKSTVKEKHSIVDLVKAFSIFNPSITFELTIDSKLQFKVLKDQPFKTTARELLGKSAFEHLIAFEYNTGAIKVSGYISAPELNRADKRYYFTAVNKRIIKCNTIRSAVDRVYKDLLPLKKYPIVIINLDLASAELDVNVHPRKQEVKYLHANEVYRTLITAISNNLSDYFYRCSEYRQLDIFNPALLADAELEPVLEVSQPLLLEIPKTQNDFQVSREPVLVTELEPVACINATENTKGELTKLSFLSRFAALEINLVEGELSDYVEGLTLSEGRESFKIFSASPDLSFGILLSASLFPADELIQDLYLDSLKALAENLVMSRYQDALETLECHSKRLSLKSSAACLSRPQSKPTLKQLEEIWARDNYSCVYCMKKLIHPKTVKEAMSRAKPEFISRLNSQHERIDEHVIEAHKASYDHHLPASKFPVLNLDLRNLFTSCRECNQKKSASLASKTWTPRPVNSWTNISINNPLELAGVKFISALEIYDN